MLNVNAEDKSFITTLFNHNTWANMQLLGACASLSSEQFDAALPGTFGSIRNTLRHILRAEVSYVRRSNVQLPDEQPKPDELPSIDALKHDAQWCGEQLLQLALNVGSSDIVREEDHESSVEYPLASLLTQAINHSTEHRAQVATILTQQGIEPPDMSGWAYMESLGQFKETRKGEPGKESQEAHSDKA